MGDSRFELSGVILTSLNVPNTEKWRILGLETTRCTITPYFTFAAGHFAPFRQEIYPGCEMGPPLKVLSLFRPLATEGDERVCPLR